MVLADPRREGTTAETAKSQFRGDVQGLRGVAVLLVVVFHSGLGLPGGFIGVDVFFTISGFVIARMLLRTLAVNGRVDFVQFYLRRARRLLPALAVTLGVVLLASVLLAPLETQGITAKTGAAASLFNANNYLALVEGGYFDAAAENNPLLHTWSLSVEEQFYFVFPALLAIAYRLGARRNQRHARQWTFAAMTAVAGVSFCLGLLMTNGHGVGEWMQQQASELAFYSAPTRAWEFAAGAMLAMTIARAPRVPGWAWLPCGAAGMGLVAGAALTFGALTPFPGVAAIVPVVGTVLLLASGEHQDGGVNGLLSLRPAQWLGDISYSWYLWHWPMIVFARALWPTVSWAPVAAGVGSLAVAWVMYRFVESPIRFRRGVPMRRTVRLALACITVPLACVTLLVAGTRAITATAPVRDFLAASDFHADYERGCDDPTPVGRREGEQCTWPGPSEKRALLLGDSNAGQFTEPFVAAAREAGYTAQVATHSACPFIDVMIVRTGVSPERCRSFVTETIQDLQETPPEVVFIANATDIYIRGEDFSFRDAQVRQSRAEKVAAMSSGLESVVRKLSDAGSRVVVMNTIPKFGEWRLRTCAPGRVLLAPGGCAPTALLSELDTARTDALAAERAAIAGTDAASGDVSAIVCAGGSCSAYRNGQWWWRDGGHLSIHGSLATTPLFSKLMPSSGS